MTRSMGMTRSINNDNREFSNDSVSHFPRFLRHTSRSFRHPRGGGDPGCLKMYNTLYTAFIEENLSQNFNPRPSYPKRTFAHVRVLARS